jgi:hypothetical protein
MIQLCFEVYIDWCQTYERPGDIQGVNCSLHQDTIGLLEIQDSKQKSNVERVLYFKNVSLCINKHSEY